VKPLVISCVGQPRVIPSWASQAILLEHPTWYQGYWLNLVKRRSLQISHRRRGIEAHLILNTDREFKMAKAFGIRCAFASQNIFINEDIFKPLNREKCFDAVYVAKLAPFKRHELAAQIAKLAIIQFAPVDLTKGCPSVAHATTNQAPLAYDEVAKFINQASCSLALSKEEGGMLASFESLLCGVPVVSTRSRGGRDIFYDSSNSTIVDADSNAVAKAVAKWVQDPGNAADIRTRALRDLATHRELYARYVCNLICRHGGPNLETLHFIKTRFGNGGVDRLFVSEASKSLPKDVIDALS
jgi:glycosyltransferase involved in cell wall biosynthesis